MNSFGIGFTAVISVIFLIGVFFVIKKKAYKYVLSLIFLLLAIGLFLLTLGEDEPGSFADLIYVLFAVVSTILSGIVAGIIFIIQSLKKNK